MLKRTHFEEADPPVARDYLDLLLNYGEKVGARGWKTVLAEEYCNLMEKITGEEQKLNSTNAHLNRVLNRKGNCTLQSFLFIAWVLGFEVKLVRRKEIKQENSIDQVA
jgi:hypothetical protein